jgi:hypothetical protein
LRLHPTFNVSLLTFLPPISHCQIFLSMCQIFILFFKSLVAYWHALNIIKHHMIKTCTFISFKGLSLVHSQWWSTMWMPWLSNWYLCFSKCNHVAYQPKLWKQWLKLNNHIFPTCLIHFI